MDSILQNLKEIESKLNQKNIITDLGYIIMQLEQRLTEVIIINKKHKPIKDEQSITTVIIGQIVANYFNIEYQDFFKKTRKNPIKSARQWAHYYAKLKTKDSLGSIGELLGNMDHSTVIHSYNIVEKELFMNKNNQKIKEDLDFLINNINKNE